MNRPLPWPALRSAMLPLDGSIPDLAPAMVDAFTAILPRSEWRDLTYVDLTAGSCLLPLAFAAGGAGRVVVNDLAPRTTIAARALFGGVTVDRAAVRDLLAQKNPQLRRHTPSFHFACDYLLEPVADIFDRLYHAPWPKPVAAVHRYLALRWIMGFATAADGSFDILLSHDPRQLRGPGWRRYLKRAATPEAVLMALADEIDRGVDLARHTQAAVHEADMLELAPRLRYPAPGLVMVNPPTNGLDEYVIDDQLVHSLLANRWLPLSQSSESAATFWTRRVRGALAPLPTGTFFLVYGGDGAVAREKCRAVWSAYGKELATGRAGKAAWAIYRRA